MLEVDLPADPAQLDRVRPVAQVGLLVEQLEDLVERRHARLVGRVELRERLDRIEEVVQRGDERHQHADRHLAVDRLQPAVQQDPGGRERRQQLDGREVRGVQVDGLHVRVAVVVVELGEPRRGGARSCANVRTTRMPDRLSCRYAVIARDLLARGAVGVRGHDPERQRAERQHREDEERQQRQLDVQHEQDRGRADQRQRRAEQRHHAVGDELVERLHVVGQPRDDHARLAARVEADRQRLQVARTAGSAGPAARAGRPSRRGTSARRSRPSRPARRRGTRSRRASASPRSPGRDPRRRSPAWPAAAARARRRCRAAAQRTSAPCAPRYGRSSTSRPRSLRPRPPVARQRRDDLVAPRSRRSQARHRLARLAREEHLVGQALLGDLGVQRAALEQLGVRAAGRDRAVLEHDDLVGERDRRQPVGDHERRAPGHHLAQRGLDRLLGRGVDRASRVVEHEHRAGRRAARARSRCRWRWPPDSVSPRSPTRVS